LVHGSGVDAHICSTIHPPKRNRRLTKGEMQLKFGNGALVMAVADGDLELILPSGLVIALSSFIMFLVLAAILYLYLIWILMILSFSLRIEVIPLRCTF
jgi:hypothetical protein